MEAIALLFLPKTVRSSAGVKENLASSGPEEFRIGSDLKIFILSKTQGSFRLTLDENMSLFLTLLDDFLFVAPMREVN